MLSFVFVWVNIGLGLHQDVVLEQNPEDVLLGAKYLFVATFFFDSSITFPKLAAIFFYARVFSKNNKNNRSFRICLWILGIVVGLWLFSAYIATIFQCWPIERAWNPEIPGKCFSLFPWYVATATISVVVDICILLLPVPMIWALQISLKRRIYLLLAFFCAYSVIVLSIGRLVEVVKIIPTIQEDLTWNFSLYGPWVIFEGTISLISVSVPNILALCKALLKNRRGSRTGSSTGTKGTKQREDGYGGGSSVHRSQARGFERLEEGKLRDLSDAESQRTLRADEAEDEAIGLGTIHVRTDFGFESSETQRRDLPAHSVTAQSRSNLATYGLAK